MLVGPHKGFTLLIKVVVLYLQNSLHELKLFINKEVFILFSPFFEENVLSFVSIFMNVTKLGRHSALPT